MNDSDLASRNMAAEVITIDNFASKMSQFAAGDGKKPLYALVDMGR